MGFGHGSSPVDSARDPDSLTYVRSVFLITTRLAAEIKNQAGRPDF
jgi:hypothetical protein